MSTIIDQDFPYDILRRGPADANRHSKKVNDAVKKQLKDIISQQDIITSEGNKKVKVKLKYLDQYRFIHNKDRVDVVGRDQFDELEENEVIYKPQTGSGGKPNQASDDEGEELYEAEFTLEQLTEMMMEDLELPDLNEKKKNEIVSEVIEYTDRRRGTGVFGCIDKKKTLLTHIVRRSKEGHPKGKKIPIIKDDLQFRTWNITTQKHSNAVVFLQMDRSGSMSEEKIYAVKALYFWIVQFLKIKYDRVEIRFISHDYVAKEINEKEFFTTAASGGTRVSSAYELCRDLIKHNYPTSMWNIYCFHASDGDSWNDEEYCVTLVKEIISLGAVLFAYTEIDLDNMLGEESELLKRLKSAQKRTPEILVSEINDMNDILETLKSFLKNSARRSLETV